MSFALLFVGGMIVGHLIERARERWYWRRLAIRTFTSAPMSTAMPTLTLCEPHGWQEWNPHGNSCHYPGCALDEEEHHHREDA